MKVIPLSLTGAVLTAATVAIAGPGSDSPKDGAVVSQIETAGKSSERAQIDSVAVTSTGGRKASAVIGQLPSDAQAPDDGLGPESNLSLAEGSPEGRLYGQVAEVWTMIRKRGLQPSPELIAREIGPDTLAQFLDKYPGATDMFGVDQDTLPVDRSGAEIVLPGGGATVNLPVTGGG